MSHESKLIYLSSHAVDQMRGRGVRADEVEDAILTATWEPAERGRWQCRKDYPYEADWNGRRFSTKAVRPIFVDEEGQIVVVTVYAYYF